MNMHKFTETWTTKFCTVVKSAHKTQL